MKNTGTIRILRLQKESVTKPAVYSLAYAPYHGGGALKSRRCDGEENVSKLLSELGVGREPIEEALKEVRKGGRASIRNVELAEEQLRQYGLGVAGLAEAILRYVSALST